MVDHVVALQQLAGSGGVDVTRQVGDGPEQATSSRELTAKFSNAGEWSTIDETGDVRFHEGLRTGQGDRAHLDRATNTATLTGSVILADATMRTTARTAIFTQGSNELRADGNVLSTELRSGTGSVTNLAAGPAHVSAAHLVADDDVEEAVIRQHRCAPVAENRIHRSMEKNPRSARLSMPGRSVEASSSTRAFSPSW